MIDFAPISVKQKLCSNSSEWKIENKQKHNDSVNMKKLKETENVIDKHRKPY